MSGASRNRKPRDSSSDSIPEHRGTGFARPQVCPLGGDAAGGAGSYPVFRNPAAMPLIEMWMPRRTFSSRLASFSPAR